MDFVFWEDKGGLSRPKGPRRSPRPHTEHRTDPGAPVRLRVAVTSINAACLSSNPQCDAALRCDSTAPSPHANTAANRRPSGRSTPCPTAYTPRCSRRSRPALARCCTARDPSPSARNCAADATPTAAQPTPPGPHPGVGCLCEPYVRLDSPPPRTLPLIALAARDPKRERRARPDRNRKRLSPDPPCRLHPYHPRLASAP